MFHISEFNLDMMCKSILENNPSEIWFLAEPEWEWKFNTNLLEILKKSQAKVKILHGSFDCSYYDDVMKDYGIDRSSFHFWPVFFLHWGENCLYHEFNYKKTNNSFFDKPFVTYNGNPHVHRCHLIDQYARLNLIDKGIVSWNIKGHFNFKYFDNNIISKDNYLNILHSYIVTEEYQKCFVDCIAEATSIVPFLTEKTTRPLLMKKPFVVLACKDYSNYLKKLGFELYDEFIDYSFDKFSDLETRANLYAENVKNNICSISDFNKLYQKLLPKIEHNYNTAIKIINQKTHFPDFIKDSLNNQALPPRYKYLFERRITDQ